MIRRGFWLTTGAVTGIVAYRRVSAVGRRVSASLGTGTSPRRSRLTAIRATRETFRFTRDVREGMGLYMARHSESAGPTLRTNPYDDKKDGH